ncbi:MAG: Fur family transcriptional regulator [Chloroflexota bacterium]|nr:Fur family transcriptional regulator [Chloroflexota bacterium]
MMIEKQLLDTLKQAGLRVTPQRQAICAYLAGNDEHPTAAMIYEALKEDMPSLSLMTVYNTLNTLAELGAIQVIGQVGDDTVHYDPDTEPHVNVVCVSCQKIIDMPSDRLSKIREEIDSQSGFKLLGARMVFYGLCPDCQAEAGQSSGN